MMVAPPLAKFGAARLLPRHRTVVQQHEEDAERDATPVSPESECARALYPAVTSGTATPNPYDLFPIYAIL
jgi:hypothetical protein